MSLSTSLKTRLWPARRTLARWTTATLCLAALLGSCSDPTGSGAFPRQVGLVLHPIMPAGSQFASAVLAVEQIRVTVTTRPDTLQRTDTVYVRSFPFGPNANSLTIAPRVPLSQPAETLDVHLDYNTASGITLFSAVTFATVTVGGTSDANTDFGPTYVGPGLNIAFFNLAPDTGTVVGGDSLVFSATAFDSSGAQVPSFYVSWSTDNPLVTVNAKGVLKAPDLNATVQVTALTPNGFRAFATVRVVPHGSAPLGGRVISATDGSPIAGASLAFKDAGGKLVDSVVTGADGSYTTGPLPGGVYTADVTAAGFTGTQVYDAAPAAGGTTLPTIPLVFSDANGGNIQGGVTDARTGKVLQGVALEARSGVNNTTGQPISSTTTDVEGAYSLQTPPGTFTVVAKLAGYADGQLIVGNVQGTSSANLSLSPSGSNDVRVVLQWGATPPDLDAHLTGPDKATPGTRFHVYFSSQGSLEADPFAALDVDNTSGFGPETITITQQSSGVYRYSVHDFSDDNLTTGSPLAASGARVDLYIHGVLVQQFFVPNQPGTLWTVFELNGSTVTPKNLMSFQPNSSAVTAPGMDRTELADQASLWRDILAHPKHH
ncbi:MAG: carboxypeptidase regulatory-like domain-containing protein [Gemmatimonadota bacterium]